MSSNQKEKINKSSKNRKIVKRKNERKKTRFVFNLCYTSITHLYKKKFSHLSYVLDFYLRKVMSYSKRKTTKIINESAFILIVNI